MLEYVNIHVDYCFKGYLIGTINKIGLKVNIPKNLIISQDTDVKLYLRMIINLGIKNNFSYEIYGFKDYRERNLFNELIEINGIGPKTAIAIIEYGIENLINSVKQKDFNNFKQTVKISTKQISAVISYLTYKFELQPKIFEIESGSNTNQVTSELYQQTSATLLALGYSKASVELIMKRMNFNELNDVSDAVNQAIKLMN